MDIKIGVTDHAREISIQLADDTDRVALKADIDAALAGTIAVLWVTDDKGKDVAVASSRMAFVEVGPEGSNNPIGFG